jgi:uncharacterized membrane protein YtjA (UPF0391 family)
MIRGTLSKLFIQARATGALLQPPTLCPPTPKRHLETEQGTVVGSHEDAYQLKCASERYNMEITITTPALLFPAISLLMISYTTRFLHLAHLARSLHAINPGAPEPTVLEQIKNIRKRILLIRNMQATGISSLLSCVICMFLLLGGQAHIAQALFIASLVLMIVSLLFSLGEIWISVDALNVHLRGIAEGKRL